MTAPALSVISAKKGEMSPVLLETAGSSPMMGCFPEPACESQENPGNVRPSSLRLKH